VAILSGKIQRELLTAAFQVGAQSVAPKEKKRQTPPRGQRYHLQVQLSLPDGKI
jgi:hypothetical protein